MRDGSSDVCSSDLGFSVDNPTLNRFFSLHYLLPFVIVAVVFLHVAALHVHGSNNPLGIEPKTPQDTIPFHPYYTVKDTFGTALFLIFFAAFVRSEEHTSEIQALNRNSYDVFCLKKKKHESQRP